MEQQLLRVIFDDGWKICFRADAFGPYPTKQDALLTARRWQHNAERQGHEVQVLVEAEGEERRAVAAQ